MSLTTELREHLAIANLSMDRFRELVTRLLSYGVLVRDEDRTEQMLYDDARRIEATLAGYLEIAGFRACLNFCVRGGLVNCLSSDFFNL